MFVVKRGEYFRKYNIFEVDFDSKVCISMGCIHKKESMTSHPSFILQTSIFVQKSLKMGQNGPLYREICHICQLQSKGDRSVAQRFCSPKIKFSSLT